MNQKVLVTGAFGQIGVELVPHLQTKHGKQNVIALGHHNIPKTFDGIIEQGDICSMESLTAIFTKYQFTQVYHMAAVLSVTGQAKPNLAWDVNLLALKSILDLSVKYKINKIFWPSSIAAFGSTTPRENVPQRTILQPTTMYGLTKVSGELLCQYYNKKYGLDIRCVRYPGIISWKELPGGGTTDYAVEIFYQAIKHQKYTSFVSKQTRLPMMYMDDAIRGTLAIMQASNENIKTRMGYNMAAMSFSVEQLATQIKKKIPQFKIFYQPDHRQQIADSWPNSFDDTEARLDWNWKPQIDIQKLVEIMLTNLVTKLKIQ